MFQELDKEKQKTESLESIVADMKKEHDQVMRVMEMMKKELEEYKILQEENRTNLSALK